MKKISKKQLFAVLLFVGLVTGGNCAAKTPEYSPQQQELKYRVDFFDTLIDAFKTIINAPAVYIKNICGIDGLDKKTKEQYAKTTTGYITKFSKLLNVAMKKLTGARNKAKKELGSSQG